MPEDQNVAGDLWLDKTVEILTSLGWEQHGDKKVDIETKIGKIGVDAYFTYFDPYERCQIGCFIEARVRQAKSVNPGFYTTSIKRISDGITNIPVSEEFNQKLNFKSASKVNSALLMLWVNDGKYNHEKFLKNLKEIEVPKKWHLQKIFIASNQDLKRFCSIIDTTKEILLDHNTKEFKYYYPSLPGLKNLPDRQSHLTLEYLYSKIIFAQLKIKQIDGEDEKTKKILVVYYFGDITLEGLKLMYSAFLRFQLLDEVFNIWIHLPEYNHVECRSAIEEFKRYFKNETHHSSLKLEIKNMSPTVDNILSWRVIEND